MTVEAHEVPGAPRGEAGFSLVEVMVSLGLVGTVMAAMSAYFVSAVTLTHGQGQREVAAQVATDAMEYVRTLPTADVGTRVRALPPRTLTVNGIAYTQRWTVCWQAVDGGACATVKPAAAAAAAMVRVTATVEWDQKDCPVNPTAPARRTCGQTTATLFSAATTEPIVEVV
ncbi:hypothetical protein GCM10010124_33440 [Pilimelia terevasa]|uniref:Prepilin-type N-terminal cleavage/methylation domain-containing protein n=1 Tax=Pilimelia terevasa TaxID=53372 RepID=A0A8J3BTE0_9ACTN|nr:prepilin-type N-terminal cleavage/methylation domain-containing protein [Pilimelia terevasa]GGK37921.1 hypothetical protein GCM10010124_33440 [Pilimelia terevasa]